MFQIDKNSKLNVGELKLKLLRGRITRQRFNFPMTEQQAADLLTAAYMAEVEFRRRPFIGDAETEQNIARLAKFLTTDSPKFGIMFCGTCGNGKTTLLHALRSATNLLNNNGAFADTSTGLVIVDAKEVAQRARDPKKFSEMRKWPLMAIEDMGREPTEVLDFGNVMNPVVDLVEYRYDNQLFTAITTNLAGKQISEKYGRRIADRFNEMLEVIIFKNSTYRK